MEKPIRLLFNNVQVVYSDVIQALKGVSLTIRAEEVIALLGGNGAGKTTVLKTISGLLQPEQGRVTGGSIEYEGKAIHNGTPETMTGQGVFHILEGRQAFTTLTVEENLRVGLVTRRGAPYRDDLQKVYECFPALLARKRSLAAHCTAGELQMLAIGRALMARPRLLLLDEPSSGLAPLMVKELFLSIGHIQREQGLTLMVAEQNANMALQIAHYGYVLENGKIVMESSAGDLRKNSDVKDFYLGTAAAGVLATNRNGHPPRQHQYWL